MSEPTTKTFSHTLVAVFFRNRYAAASSLWVESSSPNRLVVLSGLRDGAVRLRYVQDAPVQVATYSCSIGYVITVAVYESCRIPTLTTTLDFPSFSYGENTTAAAPSTTVLPTPVEVTYTTVRDGSTVYITSTLPPVSLPQATTTLALQISTKYITITTERDGSRILLSLTVEVTLPQATATLPAQISTEIVTLTTVLQGSTVLLTSVTLPQATATLPLMTLPQQTSLIVRCFARDGLCKRWTEM